MKRRRKGRGGVGGEKRETWKHMMDQYQGQIKFSPDFSMSPFLSQLWYCATDSHSQHQPTYSLYVIIICSHSFPIRICLRAFASPSIIQWQDPWIFLLSKHLANFIFLKTWLYINISYIHPAKANSGIAYPISAD